MRSPSQTRSDCASCTMFTEYDPVPVRDSPSAFGALVRIRAQVHPNSRESISDGWDEEGFH